MIDSFEMRVTPINCHIELDNKNLKVQLKMLIFKKKAFFDLANLSRYCFGW